MYQSHPWQQPQLYNPAPTTHKRSPSPQTPSSPHIKQQQKTRIFKSPYLIQGSYEKFKKQEELSDKSTEKQVKNGHPRKKIFEPKSTIESEMKYSTMSADARNRKINNDNNFESNPVRHKIKNSRNRSIGGNKKSQQGSFTQMPFLPPPQPQQPQQVIFNYSSNPQSQIYQPINMAVSRVPVSRTISYPQPQPQPEINYGGVNRQFQGYIEKHPISYYSMPVYQQQKLVYQPKIPVVSGSYQYKPRIQQQVRGHIPPSLTPIQVQNNQYAREVPTLDHVPLQKSPPQIIHNNTPAPTNLLNSFGMSKQPHQHPAMMNTRPLTLKVKKSDSMDNYLEGSKNLKKSIILNQQRRESPKRQPITPHIQHSVHRNMYETYKVGQRFRPSSSNSNSNNPHHNPNHHNEHHNHHHNHNHNHNQHHNNLLHIPHKPQSPTKDPKNSNHNKHAPPSVSSFASNSVAEQSVDLHEVEEINEGSGGGKYSDRFFDMDFKEAKKESIYNAKKCIQSKEFLEDGDGKKDGASENMIHLRKMGSERKDYDERSPGLTKKGTINSIALQKQSLKKLETMKDLQNSKQQQFQSTNSPGKLGTFIPYILIGLGFILVLIQILK